jgi:hypothetical protein
LARYHFQIEDGEIEHDFEGVEMEGARSTLTCEAIRLLAETLRDRPGRLGPDHADHQSYPQLHTGLARRERRRLAGLGRRLPHHLARVLVLARRKVRDGWKSDLVGSKAKLHVL